MEIIKGEDLKGMQFVKDEEGRYVVYESKGRYTPKIGEEYWYVSTFGDINNVTSCNDSSDEWLIKHHLVFRTKEECEDYKGYLEQLDKYSHEFSKEEWEDKNVEKWRFCYFYQTKELHITFTEIVCEWSCYFTENLIKQFRETVGDERIKKYMFDVWE